MMFALGTRVGFDEVALNLKLPTGVSGSAIVTENGPAGISIKVLRSAIGAIDGGRFPTVSTNESLALLCPSPTMMVMAEVPTWAVAGVIVTVRLAPLPANAILSIGTRDGFDEVALSVRLSRGVSRSFRTKGIAAVGVLAGVD